MPILQHIHKSDRYYKNKVLFPAQTLQTPENISVRIISEVEERIGKKHDGEIVTLDSYEKKERL